MRVSTQRSWGNVFHAGEPIAEESYKEERSERRESKLQVKTGLT